MEGRGRAQEPEGRAEAESRTEEGRGKVWNRMAGRAKTGSGIRGRQGRGRVGKVRVSKTWRPTGATVRSGRVREGPCEEEGVCGILV